MLIQINDRGLSWRESCDTRAHAPVKATDKNDAMTPQTSRSSAVQLAETLRHYLTEQEKFCARLEAVADLLPDGADRSDCLLLAQNVVPLVKRAHEFEENELFPVLMQEEGVSAEMRASLERLRFEHMGDEDYAAEISNALRQFVTERERFNVDSLAWMLRGFFEGLRRHIAFERAYVLSLIESKHQ